jgi:hypothetical protein
MLMLLMLLILLMLLMLLPVLDPVVAEQEANVGKGDHVVAGTAQDDGWKFQTETEKSKL